MTFYKLTNFNFNFKKMATYLNPMHFKHLNQKEKIEIEKILESLEISLFNAAVLVINNNKYLVQLFDQFSQLILNSNSKFSFHFLHNLSCKYNYH